MDSKPVPPKPPKSLPPMPPAQDEDSASPKNLPAPAAGGAGDLYLRKRLQKMEKDLAAAHQKAFAAEQIFKRQQAVKTEVESYLRNVTEQLKREKAEREAQEQKSHDQGRVDALERRLDEVHQSLLSVIRESFAANASSSKGAAAPSPSPVPDEFGRMLLTLSSEIDRLRNGVEAWRGESKKALEGIPEQMRRREEESAKELGRIAAGLNDRISAWERVAQLEMERQRERLEEFARERAALARTWEEQNHAVRQEHLEESLRRQSDIESRIAAMEQKILEAQRSNAAALEEVRESADKISKAMAASPAGRDEIIAGLETEKLKLLDALKEKSQTLSRISQDRRASEEDLAGKIMILHQKLDEERRAQDSLRTRLSDLESENDRLAIRLEAAEKSVKDKEGLYAALAAQKDEISKTLLSELAKGREQAAKSRQIQQDAERRVEDVEKRLAQAAERTLTHEMALGQLRNQIAASSEQLTRALKEKDELQTRYAAWDREKEKLMAALREKDEMLAMLNSTFRNMLGKP
ncbi:MAG: hypothetical protein KGL04_10055 [Elusimicrobia bacterium]|nr:hypothetical protein [Elusimicrobiota bacterium]